MALKERDCSFRVIFCSNGLRLCPHVLEQGGLHEAFCIFLHHDDGGIYPAFAAFGQEHFEGCIPVLEHCVGVLFVDGVQGGFAQVYLGHAVHLHLGGCVTSFISSFVLSHAKF